MTLFESGYSSKELRGYIQQFLHPSRLNTKWHLTCKRLQRRCACVKEISIISHTAGARFIGFHHSYRVVPTVLLCHIDAHDSSKMFSVFGFRKCVAEHIALVVVIKFARRR